MRMYEFHQTGAHAHTFQMFDTCTPSIRSQGSSGEIQSVSSRALDGSHSILPSKILRAHAPTYWYLRACADQLVFMRMC
jgi:hypothetical protein